jgi:hypothetical protein
LIYWYKRTNADACAFTERGGGGGCSAAAAAGAGGAEARVGVGEVGVEEAVQFLLGRDASALNAIKICRAGSSQNRERRNKKKILERGKRFAEKVAVRIESG